MQRMSRACFINGSSAPRLRSRHYRLHDIRRCALVASSIDRGGIIPVALSGLNRVIRVGAAVSVASRHRYRAHIGIGRGWRRRTGGGNPVNVVGGDVRRGARVQLNDTLWGIVVIPFPDKVWLNGVFSALLVKTIVPLALPVAAGANATLKLTLCPAARVTGIDSPLRLNPVPETTA